MAEDTAEGGGGEGGGEKGEVVGELADWRVQFRGDGYGRYGYVGIE